MKTNPDESAFPHAGVEGVFPPEYGLTKREYFAAFVCMGLYANPDIASRSEIGDFNIVKGVEQFSVHQADALIAALNEEKA